MKFTFLTLFPNLITPYFDDSIMGRALRAKKFSIECVNPRDFSNDKHKKVDDYIAGGTAGLLMRAEPIMNALKSINSGHIIALSPAGKKFNSNDAKRLSKKEHLIFICGRYEGIDERVNELVVNEIFSIGDFVLSGGELGALCLSDAIARQIKGVLGNESSLEIESFENNLLEAPSFTKPNVYENSSVISAYLKGNHATIRTLKFKMALCKTQFFRPDLYAKIAQNAKTRIKNEK